MENIKTCVICDEPLNEFETGIHIACDKREYALSDFLIDRQNYSVLDSHSKTESIPNDNPTPQTLSAC